ncbi:MAG: DUF1080 domain-containing protein [Planctomycetia bacterium]|nr:DUF1080 domain-containing protein [Planctomycetia bacterium]
MTPKRERGLRKSYTRHLLPSVAFLVVMACLATVGGPARAEAAGDWVSLFDGRSLGGWKATDGGSLRVEDGCLVGRGPRGWLFYDGAVGGHDFRNFELEVEVRAEVKGDSPVFAETKIGTVPEAAADSGVWFHTRYLPSGGPKDGYEVRIDGGGDSPESRAGRGRTGGLEGVRPVYKSFVPGGDWCRVRVCVVGNRIRVWVNDLPTVDYIQPERPWRTPEHAGRVLSHGTIALAGPDSGGVAFRSIRVRPLLDDAKPTADARASDRGYGVEGDVMDRLAGRSFPVIDYHVHLRGGMTVEKALDRQAVTGINCGVLENLGKGWPLETDDQLRAFLDAVRARPVFVGVQVNDRDWTRRHSPELLARLDYVLGDTMIMPMPNDDSEPVKLWLAGQYTIDDAETWMERYVRHNLRVLAEPITILANPTYLPPAVADKYDQLWTDARMRRIIEAAVANRVALEINAQTGLPHDPFLRMAKQMGAKFTFGSNNSDDKPIDMTRCFEAAARCGLAPEDIMVPKLRP